MHIITEIVAVMGYPGILLWMLVGACLPIPSEAVLPFAGMLNVTKHMFNLHVLAFVGAIGNLLGSMIGYWIGASKGRTFFEKYGRYFLISRKDLAAADHWFARYGEATVFFTRMMPVIRAVISYPAGIARMPFGKFCVYSFFGGLAWCYLLVYAGIALGRQYDKVGVYIHKVDLGIGVLIVAAIAFWVWKHLKDAREDAAAARESVAPLAETGDAPAA